MLGSSLRSFSASARASQQLERRTTSSSLRTPSSEAKMAGLLGYRSLPPKAKNLVVAGGLTAFVFGAYFYTMRAVGGTDELQVAIDKFESDKSKKESEANIPSKV